MAESLAQLAKLAEPTEQAKPNACEERLGEEEEERI